MFWGAGYGVALRFGLGCRDVCYGEGGLLAGQGGFSGAVLDGGGDGGGGGGGAPGLLGGAAGGEQ